jgi:cyclopropane-fatty-acyl-phospholipid synthase
MPRHALPLEEPVATRGNASPLHLIERVLDGVRQRAAERRVSFNVEFWNGHRETFGSAPRVTLKLNNPKVALRLLKPDLGTLGEAYVEGDIDLEGSAADIVELAIGFASGDREHRPTPWISWRRGHHGIASDARAIAYHYDVSNDFYRLWLDRNMVYSCADFHDGTEDLDRAQELKLDLICRKLRLRPGEHFLDIGCGWGALVLWAAQHYGVQATGVTISQQQYDYARQRVADAGLASQVEIRLEDYRKIPGEAVYDKIASVGMFEHVGLKNLPTYFGTIYRLLKDDGLVLNHGITTRTSADDAIRGGAGDFIERYVFPDGELGDVARAMSEMAQQNLEVFDVEGLRPHYAQTLMHWVTRLERQREAALALVGEKRYRIWRIYMAGCALAFERGWISVYQLLAAKHAHPGLSPQAWNRDYLLGTEAQATAVAPAVPQWPPRLH